MSRSLSSGTTGQGCATNGRLWLGVASFGLIVVVTVGLVLVQRPTGGLSPLELLWETFATTFSLAVPTSGGIGIAELALWFVLALGGIFIVSALVGLLTSGLNQQKTA